jgi:hypothetical protein
MALLLIHIIHIFNIFPARLRIIEYIQGIFCCLLELNYYLMVQTFLSVQDYKRTCDIINIYKLYKVKAQESSSHLYSLRERVGLGGRVISGSDLKPLQYVLKDLVNVQRSL